MDACRKTLGVLMTKLEECLIIRLIGAEIVLHSFSFGNMHISLYSTLGRRTLLGVEIMQHPTIGVF